MVTQGALYTKLPGNPIVFAILFTFVTKLQLLRWFDGNNEEKKRISDALSKPSLKCNRVYYNYKFLKGGTQNF